MRIISLFIFISIFAFESVKSQNSEIVNVDIKFVDDNNNPINNLPVDIRYRGGVNSQTHYSNQNGLINVNILRFNPLSDSEIFGCLIDIVFEDYIFQTSSLRLNKDNFKEDSIITYKLDRMHKANLVKGSFDNLSGRISLSDLVQQDTIYLYENYGNPSGLSPNMLSINRLSSDVFRFVFYSRDPLSYKEYKDEKLGRIEIANNEIEILLDDTKLNFDLIVFGHNSEFRYMLIRQ